MELSILIATMPSRSESLDLLLKILGPQIIDKCIEICTDDSMEYNIGVKRNKLLERAKGEYIVFIDDDDHIPPYYIEEIMNALASKPDCVGIQGVVTTNGKDHKKWFISKDYKEWFEKNNIYYRTPNHISPVKRELAIKARFPEISFGEDYGYSMNLLPLLKTEVKINEQNMYHYDYKYK